jgi:hypothetical protein
VSWDFETSLVAELEANEELFNVVDDRIFPAVPSEVQVLPLLVYRIAEAPRDHHLDGACGIVRARIEFEVLSLDPADCTEAREAIRTRLDGFKGILSASVRVAFAALVNESDVVDEPADGTGTDEPTHRKLIEFKFTYKETVPAL